MQLGKWLVVIGLATATFGAFCVAWRGPRAVPDVITRDGPDSIAGTPFGRFAERWGWWLILTGFVLQLVGTVLWR